MPLINDTRRERYAQNLAKGMPRTVGYADAGYQCTTPASLQSNADARASEPDIKARVAELLTRAAGRAEIKAQLKAEDIVEMLVSDRKLARELGQPSAAIRAAELLGKNVGMWVDKKEIKIGALDEFSQEQLNAIIVFGQDSGADGELDAEPTRRLEESGGRGEAVQPVQELLP